MKKILIVFIILLSCKSTEKIAESKAEIRVEQESEKTSKPKIEISAGSDIKIQDVELRDFRNFKVWVTTKNIDTIGNCKLEKVPSIKGIEKLPHFFVKFQTLPIVYKMKIENNELVFANLNTSSGN